MIKALFAALASVALLGASCSVQDFSTVVMDKPTISAEMPIGSYSAVSNADGYLSTSKALGKYAFRYGALSDNLYFNKIGDNDYYKCAGYIDDNGSLNTSGMSDQPKWITFDFTANNTYTLSFDCRGGNNAYQLCVGFDHGDGTYERVLFGYGSFDTSGFSRVYTTFSLTKYASRFFVGMFDYGSYLWLDTGSIMIQRGSVSSTPAYQPFGYGVSVDTPFLSAPRSFSLPLDGNLKPDGQFTYNGFANDGVHWMFKYGYHYDAAHPRTMQTCIGMVFVSEEQRSVFLQRFTDLALPRREYSNCSYKDYELSAVDSTDGHCGIYLYFRPVFSSNTLLESYMSFNTGSYDDGYTDGNDYGYMVGYQAQTYEIVKGIEEVSLSYIVGSGDDAENRNVTKSNGEAFELLRAHCINGLLSLDSIYDELIPSSDSDAHSLVLLLSYSDAKTVDAAPLYVDYKQLADPIPFAQQTSISVYTPVNLPIQRWNAFSGHLDVGYQGQLGNYPNLSYDERFRNYTRISVTYPTRNVGGALRYLGILSDYTRGYADGVSSRDGEIDDLTNRILGLQEDLSQYQGKDYQQIYNLGYQAGLDENAQGAATFNSLFGNILTAPLTILNGLTDISFFGMPILTAILSLLMVAMALFLFKRFK